MSFQEGLQKFSEDNLDLLRRGKDLLAALDDERSKNYVNKPFLLKIVLEKYLELIEEKLIPALPALGEPQEPAKIVAKEPPQTSVASIAQETVAKAEQVKPKNTDQKEEDTGSYHICTPHLVENFRSANVPRPAPIAAKAAPPPKKPTNNHDEAFKKAAMEKKLGPDPRTMIHSPPGSRRGIPRYSCRMSLSYSVKGKDAKMHKAFSKDVGALGLFIMANRPEKAGDQVEIEIELPEVGRATIQAVVAWTKWVPQNLRTIDFPGFGVKITNATENWYSYFMEAG